MMVCRLVGLIALLASLCGAAIKSEVSREACRESNQIGIRLINEEGNDRTQQARMVDVRRWFLEAEKSVAPESFFKLVIKPPLRPPASVVVTEVRIVTASPEDWTPDPRRLDTWKPPDMLEVCLDVAEDLAPGESTVTLSFEDIAALPPELKPIVDNTVTGPVAAAQPTDPREDSNRPKRYERELDLMFVLLSSVKDNQESFGTVRSRDTSANTDLRLAPILNWKRINLRRRDYLLTFFTPFVATAKVSNKPITKDTLSVNQIVLGSEFEFRKYLRNAEGLASDNRLRIILKGNNTSDRDFKLNESKGAVEFRPVLGRLFRDIRNPKYLEKMKHPPKLGLDYKFGRTLIPVAGFEAGNSYTRGRPAGDLQPIGAFYRAYLGADATLNVQRRLILSITQTFYYRAELDTDRWAHYSKNTLEWSFTSPSTLLGAAAYLTFEKGRLPPFNSSVNAVKLGVRLQSQGWTDYLR